MYIVGKYKESDKMSDLICDNYQMLLVISRFEIKLGFGEQTIGEVCSANGVDVDTFLAIVNLIVSDSSDHRLEMNPARSIPSLVKYLQNSHTYFLDFRLPCIRRKLLEALGDGERAVVVVIVRFFDEYASEVRKHMQYEEEHLFPYIHNLVAGKADERYSIEVFSKQHSHIDEKLSELKNILIKYYTASSNELNSVLFDIFTCSDDLASHNAIEDCLVVPLVTAMEDKKRAYHE